MPPAKRRKTSHSDEAEETEYTGSLPAEDVLQYEIRVEEITEDMEDLNVEDIKRQVLDTHFSGNSRPSSSASSAPVPAFLSSYTKMDDFTAIVTATVLQALPNLSRLMRLMDVWSIRLAVLRKVPPLLAALDDAEVALKSGWNAIHHTTVGHDTEDALSRETFEVMRDVLQDKVTTLGQDLDYMLDTLEGRQDTLPEIWLDRMEAIEHDYGEWVVSGDRKVREGEWARMAKARKEAEEARRLKEAEAKEAARLKAEQEAEEARKLEEQRAAETAKRKAEEDAENERRLEAERVAEQARKLEEEQAAETAKRKAEQDAENERVRLKAEQEAEEARKLEERAAETARRKAEDAENERRRLEEEQAAEEARRKAEIEATEAKRLQEEEAANEVARQKAQQDADDAQRLAEEKVLETTKRQAEQDAEAEAAETARRQALEAAQAQAAESEAQAELARRKVEQLRLEGALSEKDSASDDLPEVSEKTEHFDADDISPALVTNPPTAIVAPLEDAVSSVDLSLQPQAVPSFDGSSDSHTEPSTPSMPHREKLEAGEDGQVSQPTNGTKEPSDVEAHAQLPETPPRHLLSGSDTGKPSPAVSDAEDRISKDEGSPRVTRPRSIPRFGHALANFIRRSSPPRSPANEPTRTSPELRKASLVKDTDDVCQDPDHFPVESNIVSPIPSNTQPSQSETIKKPTDSEDLTMVDSAPEDRVVESDPFSTSTGAKNQKLLDVDNTKKFKRHSRNDSQLSGYATSEPTPEIQEAEPAEYFRPVVSPVKSPVLSTEGDGEPVTLTVSKMSGRQQLQPNEDLDPLDDQPSSVVRKTTTTDLPDEAATLSNKGEVNDKSDADPEFEDQEDSILSTFSSQNSDIDFSTPVVAHRASLTRINTGIKQISLSRPQSSSSDTPTIVTGSGDHVGTPVIPSSPLGNELQSFPEDEQSPSAGRIGLRNGKPSDISPPGSPPMRAIRPTIQTPSSPTFSTISESDVSTVSMDAPVFENVDVLETPITSSPTRTSDDQLQQQISSILQSIPTRIRLTSEPDAHQTDTLKPKKTRERRSITPSLRSHSSLSNYSSSRAPTPSFLLSPAYSQTKTRPRPSGGNPEIKLYHLSRSTGEAPIKLFVRLVGEHGERVMVRVGGGWADLGEYLKEYASHHGRRSNVTDNDKVEIQDLPARIASGSTIRGGGAGGGRDSPALGLGSRPVSALDTRPGSSLAVRKTRKSIGESTLDSLRSPSTPLPPSRSLGPAASNDTPPSGQAPRSSSRLSWAEDDSSLGLAGPKSKKVAISERDQEWVESMKEKVRQASAEKDRERERRERGASFGEMDRVGGTKRLFRRGV